jgi:hypothetical protein
MPVSIKGSGGGSVTLDAGAAAADTTLTLPNTTGTVINTAPGTAGNVLTSTGSAWASTAPAATASLTLLATLTTTSGTTQSATGLATPYKQLLFVFQNVANTTGQQFTTLELSANNGTSYGTAVNEWYSSASSPYTISGGMTVYLADASTTSLRPVFSGGTFTNTLPAATSTAGPINAVRFAWSGGATYTAGTIYIYGVN